MGTQQETVVLMVDQAALEDQRMRRGMAGQGSTGFLRRKEKG